MPILIFLDGLLAARYNKNEIKNEALHRQTVIAPKMEVEIYRQRLATEGGYFFCVKRTKTMINNKKMFISFMGITPIPFKWIGAI